MLKINSFNFGYRFSVYVRVVAVRCGRGTLLQPMSSWCLVKDLSASSSTGCSLVVVLCYQNCIIILLICHCVYVVIVYKLRSNKKKYYGMFMSNK